MPERYNKLVDVSNNELIERQKKLIEKTDRENYNRQRNVFKFDKKKQKKKLFQ